MAYQYHRDDVNRRVVVTIAGRYSKDESLEIVRRHQMEAIGSYGILYDLMNMTGKQTLAEMREVIANKLSSNVGRLGPVAVLACEPEVYSAACTYAALASGKLVIVIEVFRDRADAETWLTQMTGGRGAGPESGLN
jgi:hypothetical protein